MGTNQLYHFNSQSDLSLYDLFCFVLFDKGGAVDVLFSKVQTDNRPCDLSV